MKITVLAENTSVREDLAAEHGLSLFIETGETKLLFDFGQSGRFAENAEKLGVDLAAADAAVLSHGHYDHGGGLKRFLELNDHAPVYLSEYAFDECYNAEGRYIGLDPALKSEPRLRFVGEEAEIGPQLRLYACNGRMRRHAPGSFGLRVKREGKLMDDDFRHELFLLAETEYGTRVLVSGCSHKGILNILGWFPADVVIGGFHLMKLEPGEALEPYAEALESCGAELFTGHCTGEAQLAWLQTRLERLHRISTGNRIMI